jgi:hypothetical protein
MDDELPDIVAAVCRPPRDFVDIKAANRAPQIGTVSSFPFVPLVQDPKQKADFRGNGFRLHPSSLSLLTPCPSFGTRASGC